MNIEFCGNICVASGKGWRYERIGDISVFTQTGKVKSLRVVKNHAKATR